MKLKSFCKFGDKYLKIMPASKLCSTLFFIFAFFTLQGQNVSPFIVTDQFGYRPNAQKTAVIRQPQAGFDSPSSFTPGAVYKVIAVASGLPAYESALTLFNSGATDTPSGDKISWFDFTPLTVPGEYYILDEANQLRSYPFAIREDVYNEVLKHAVRMFFYQRAGCEKEARFAGESWADNASHVGSGQDKNCRLYNRKNDAATERDLHGGWFDAGDYNKYTVWACRYIETMMHCYLENPDVWTDDYNIPESGNGIPDLLDEAKWGMDWLLRMQESDGSVLSIVGLASGYPPSAVTGASYYGPATTLASWAAAKAFAIGSKVFKQTGMDDYAERLETAALKAWNWAEENPGIKFHNNSPANGSQGLGAGDQELDDNYHRLTVRLTAALYLYELTGKKSYLSIFEGNCKQMPLFTWTNYVSQYHFDDQMMFLHYLTVDGASESIKTLVINALKTGFNKTEDFSGKIGKDGYRSFIGSYNWGSNEYKSKYGVTFYSLAKQSLEPGKNHLYFSAAEDYLHYIHGVNPMGLVYLTNMNGYGASRSLTEIYHTWFDHNSAKWNKVTETTPGPAPGYLAGGANAYYKWDNCCPNGCGSSANNATCRSEEVPVNQPAAKMYKDFNTSWPLNSWEITEPMGAYQIAYIRLLSKFVAAKKTDGIILPSTSSGRNVRIYPNPVKEEVNIRGVSDIYSIGIYDVTGKLLEHYPLSGQSGVHRISSEHWTKGVYIVKIQTENGAISEKIFK
jgi:hypothetical protein